MAGLMWQHRVFEQRQPSGSMLLAITFSIVWAHGCELAFAQSRDRYAALRDRLVDQEVVAAGITSRRVIAAMRATPRHEFLSRRQQKYAYYDMAIPIGHGQTISPPYVVAFMTEQLDPQPTDKVLEIGTGSGYQAAVLSGLVKDVYSIEIVEPLGRRAARTMRRLGYKNVHTKIGDGYQGWPEHAPFHKIIVTCSPEHIPRSLVEQLAEGGRMIVPLGERFQQTLCRFTKVNGKMQREALHATFFVPMTGRAEQQRVVKPDETRPQLVHTSFEETSENSEEPVGWFYVRQARVEQDQEAPAGQKVITFSNSIAGRHAQCMQAFGVDGRVVQKLALRPTSWRARIAWSILAAASASGTIDAEESPQLAYSSSRSLAICRQLAPCAPIT